MIVTIDEQHRYIKTDIREHRQRQSESTHTGQHSEATVPTGDSIHYRAIQSTSLINNWSLMATQVLR